MARAALDSLWLWGGSRVQMNYSLRNSCRPLHRIAPGDMLMEAEEIAVRLLP
jgi:hypothetical protein